MVHAFFLRVVSVDRARWVSGPVIGKDFVNLVLSVEFEVFFVALLVACSAGLGACFFLFGEDPREAWFAPSLAVLVGAVVPSVRVGGVFARAALFPSPSLRPRSCDEGFALFACEDAYPCAVVVLGA